MFPTASSAIPLRDFISTGKAASLSSTKRNGRESVAEALEEPGRILAARAPPNKPPINGLLLII
jgi:hypothetical protein